MTTRGKLIRLPASSARIEAPEADPKAVAVIEEAIALHDGTKSTQPGPAFYFYPTNFFGDQRVQAMSLAAQAVHIALMSYAWSQSRPPGSIPADADFLREQVGGEYRNNRFIARFPEAQKQQDREWREVLGQTLSAWVKYKDKLWQVGICKSYIKQIEDRRYRSTNGKQGADKTWGKPLAEDAVIEVPSSLLELPGFGEAWAGWKAQQRWRPGVERTRLAKFEALLAEHREHVVPLISFAAENGYKNVELQWYLDRQQGRRRKSRNADIVNRDKPGMLNPAESSSDEPSPET
jgi:hypothetical protein